MYDTCICNIDTLFSEFYVFFFLSHGQLLTEVCNFWIIQENDFFSGDGVAKNIFLNGWKGNAGLYAVGFTRRGLSGASLDAIRVAHDIAKSWKDETKQRNIYVAATHRRCISHF